MRVKATLKELTIRRDEWLRGTGNGTLCDSEGMKCCLGFYALAVGFTRGEIEKSQVPENIIDDLERATAERSAAIRKFKGLVGADGTSTSVSDMLVQHNDNRGGDDKERETNITQEFAKIGVKVTFV
jgi:agmatine/peptidylarginine deiminase